MEKKEKKPVWKKWWVWLIAIIVVFGVIGGNDSDVDSAEQTILGTEVSSTEVNSTEKQTEEVKGIYAVGEEVKLGDNILIVNCFEKFSGSEWDKPKEGNEFVVVNVTIKNGGSSEITYNPFDFEMQNSSGQITTQAFTTINNDTSLSSGSLAPGGQVNGTIAFEQPIGDSGLILKYKANMFSNKEVKVKIN